VNFKRRHRGRPRLSEAKKDVISAKSYGDWPMRVDP